MVPTVSVKRWKKQTRNKDGQVVEPGYFANYDQPKLLKNYNHGMGGVDLHDNAAQNYYIAIRQKKWYWPLWIAMLNSAIVNAWKLSCFIRRYQKQNIVPQKDFRVDIAYSLMMSAEDEQANSEEGDLYSPPDFPDSNDTQPENLPRNKGQHLIVKIDHNRKRRCKHCHKAASFLCKRCNIPLHTHCFELYHVEKKLE